jgi:hypothetical protein
MNAIGADSNDWDKHFLLMADIDLGSFTGTEFNIIGTSSNPFTGTFDGNGYTILNFTYITTGTDLIGLFRRVRGENAEIKNLGLINPTIDAAGMVGSLVGWLFIGNISGCYVNGGSVSGNSYVGGIVGKVGEFMPIIPSSEVTNCYTIVDVRGDGDCIGGIMGGSYYGRISDCYAAGNTSSRGNAVGGLVGLHQWGTISNSHAAGAIVGINEVGGLVGIKSFGSSVITSSSIGSVEGANAVGGLVGTNSYGTITNCYSAGSVAGANDVGGLVGENYSDITNCYSAGSVVGANDVGGLIGINERGTVVSSFWDIETSGLNNMCGGQGPDGSGCDNANGKTTAEMQTESTFTDAGWDFVGETANGTDDIWKMCEWQDYPGLSWETWEECTKYGGGSGIAEDPYLIYNAGQMNAIGADSNDWDKHFRLMADIDLGGYTGTSFNLIGFDVYNSFVGVFDGNSHTISNFTWSSSGSDFIGLFRYVVDANALIKDVELINPNIDGGNSSVGSLVG